VYEISAISPKGRIVAERRTASEALALAMLYEADRFASVRIKTPVDGEYSVPSFYRVMVTGRFADA
jgi:hypothetical protein